MGHHHIPNFVLSLVHKDTLYCEHLKVWILQWQVSQGGAAGIDLFNYVNIIRYMFLTTSGKQHGWV